MSTAQRPEADAESLWRRLVIGFGTLLLVLLIAGLVGGWLYLWRSVEADEQRLAVTLADVLAESIHRVSFSGKYHGQLLVEGFVEDHPDLVFIRIETSDGGTWASAGSQPAAAADDGRSSRVDGARVVEIVRPFRAGFPEKQIGVIRIGVSRARADQTFRRGLWGLLAFGSVAAGVGLWGVVRASRHIAGPVEVLGREFAGLLDHAPLAVTIQDENGRIERFSSRFEELFGRGRSLRGLRMRDLFEPSAAARLREEERELLAGDADLVRREGTLAIEGDRRTFGYTRFRLGPPGAGARVVTLALDITEQRKLEETLTQSRRMESIGQFAGGVAHDFNNLLTGIAGSTDLIELAEGDREAIAEQCVQLRSITAMAAELTGRLLSFGRKQITVLEPQDLHRILRDLERFVARILREDVEFAMELGDDLLPVRVDRGQIDQVVMNLLSNARDAMGAGGRITLRTGRRTLAREEVVGKDLLPPGDYAEFTVQDEGGGIPEAMRESLFNPFATTKGLGKGTGLGLSIVYGIVTRHQGAIDFESEEGVGTTFRVLLPAIDAAELAQEERLATSAPAPERRLRLLVIEDNAFVRSSVVGALRRREHEVWEAQDGQEGLDVFAAQAGGVDAVLVDMIMPRLNGNEVFDAIRERDPDVAVLFMTGYDDELLQDALSGDTHVGWIQKPFTLRALTDRLMQLLG